MTSTVADTLRNNTLTIIRIIQYYVLKYKDKDTFNLDGWEQGITAERLQEVLLNHQVATDLNGVCLFRKKTNYLKLVYKALGIDDTLPRPTIDEVYRFKNTMRKMKFI